MSSIDPMPVPIGARRGLHAVVAESLRHAVVAKRDQGVPAQSLGHACPREQVAVGPHDHPVHTFGPAALDVRVNEVADKEGIRAVSRASPGIFSGSPSRGKDVGQVVGRPVRDRPVAISRGEPVQPDAIEKRGVHHLPGADPPLA